MDIKNNGGDLPGHAAMVRRLGVLKSGDVDPYNHKEPTAQDIALGIAKNAVLGSVGIPGMLAVAVYDRVKAQQDGIKDNNRDSGHYALGIQALAEAGVPGYMYQEINGSKVAVDATALARNESGKPYVIIQSDGHDDPKVQEAALHLSSAAANQVLGASQQAAVDKNDYLNNVKTYDDRFRAYVSALGKKEEAAHLNPGPPPTEPVSPHIQLASEVGRVYQEEQEKTKAAAPATSAPVVAKDMTAPVVAASPAPVPS